jgi:hypothetical protein
VSSRRLALILGTYPPTLAEPEPSDSLVGSPPSALLTDLLYSLQSDEDLAEALRSGNAEAAQRFLQTIPPRFPFFGTQTEMKSSRTSYPALSGSQISHLDLFQDLDHAQNRNAEGIASRRRAIDMALAGNAFDFAANIGQLHFQPPTAQ